MPALLAAADRSERSRLDEIRTQVEVESTRLEEIAAQQRQLQEEGKRLQSSLNSLRTQEEQLTKQLDTSSADRQRLEEEIAEAEQRSRFLKGASRARLRALYMHHSDEVLSRLFLGGTARRWSEVGRNALFLSKVRVHDLAQIKELAQIKTERERRSKALKKLVESQEALRQKILDQRQTIRVQLQKKDSVVKALNAERTRKESSLVELRAQALRLETVVQSLTGGDDEAEEPPRSSRGREPRHEVSQFEGRGLEIQKGSLLRPVVGKVTRSFGKYKAQGFSDMVFSKGIEFAGESGADVRAVAAGKVIFNGSMPGYGSVVILDHGVRWYTLYASVSSVAVSKGDVVERGERIARAGNGVDRTLYFELRRNGEPINPQPFFGASR